MPSTESLVCNEMLELLRLCRATGLVTRSDDLYIDTLELRGLGRPGGIIVPSIVAFSFGFFKNMAFLLLTVCILCYHK
jgi:hypothetical protein